MQRFRKKTIAVLAVAILALAIPATAMAQTTAMQAQEIALAMTGGGLISSLEMVQDGAWGSVYNIIVVHGDTIFDIAISVQTGDVLRMSTTTAQNVGGAAAAPVAAPLPQRERQRLFSIGAGMMIDFMSSDSEVRYPVAVSSLDHAYTMVMDSDHVGFGGWVFFDARFAEFSVGFFAGPTDIEFQRVGGGDDELILDKYTGLLFAMDFNLLLRWPIPIVGGTIELYPLLGFGYHMVLRNNLPNLVESRDISSSTSAFNVWRVNFGAGADFFVSQTTFIRLQGMAYYRTPSTVERNFQRDRTEGATRGPLYGFGGTFRVGVGFRF
ncbi:MAG: hypothetical protein FWG66_10450 [Spirochaetes bacterium]|nr:hypothetical protein [Spirochaetota bacterium]